MAYEEPRRPGRPPGRPTGGGLSRIGIGNAFVLVLLFGTIFILMQKEIFGAWLKVVIASAIIIGMVYSILLISKTRVTGTTEVFFVFASFLIFYFFWNYSQAIPWFGQWSLTPLDVTDASGQPIMPIAWLQLLLVALALVVIWKGNVLERLGVKF